jgi:hypothetical protein
MVQPITFGEAMQRDMDKYGDYGPYWKKAYGDPELDQIITVDGIQCVVTRLIMNQFRLMSVFCRNILSRSHIL